MSAFLRVNRLYYLAYCVTILLNSFGMIVMKEGYSEEWEMQNDRGAFCLPFFVERRLLFILQKGMENAKKETD